MQSKKDFSWWSLSSFFLFCSSTTCLFPLWPFSGHEHGCRDQPTGCYSADPSHHAPEDLDVGSFSSFPAPLSASKGLQRREDPINNPFSSYWIKKIQVAAFSLQKMSSFASYGEKVFSRLLLPQVRCSLRARWKQDRGWWLSCNTLDVLGFSVCCREQSCTGRWVEGII